eukprot:Skav221889  [mRNA]  locus=scaffold1395:555170:556222:- [translate_table: standard]
MSIHEHWTLRSFRIHKMKSHRKFNEAVDNADLIRILGNDTADKAAGFAVQRFPSGLQQSMDDAIEFYEKQSLALKSVFAYLVDFNLERFRILQVKSSKCKLVSRHEKEGDTILSAMGIDALHVLQNFELHDFRSFSPELADNSVFVANLQGTRLGWLVYHWARTLHWPSNDDLKAQDVESPVVRWGVSVLELLFNFYLLTGEFFPVRISGSAGTSVFCHYHDETAKLLPPAKRSIGHQVRSFMACVSCVETLTGQSLFPVFKQQGFTSLKRLGHNITMKGWAGRPTMLHQHDTLNLVWQYLQDLKGAATLWKSFDRELPPPAIETPIDVIDALDAHQRYCAYLRLKSASN